MQSPSVWWLVMTHHTGKANLEKGSSCPPEAMPNVTHYPKLLVLKPSSGPTPWTHPITPLGPGASLRPVYYKLMFSSVTKQITAAYFLLDINIPGWGPFFGWISFSNQREIYKTLFYFFRHIPQSGILSVAWRQAAVYLRFVDTTGELLVTTHVVFPGLIEEEEIMSGKSRAT